VAPKSTEKVDFVSAADAAGTFEVDVNGKKGTFTVNPLAEPAAPEAVSWYLIGGIIVAICAITSLIGFRIREKESYIPPVAPRVRRKR